MFIQLSRDYLGRKAGERLDVADDDARQLITQGLAQAVAGDPLNETVQRAVADTMARINGTLQQSVETALKQFTDAQTRSRKNAVPILFGAGGGGDPKRTFGQFLLAVRHGDRKALEEMGSQYAEWEGKAALTTQVGTQGGYTVPEEFLPRLLALATENAVVRPRATIIPMTSRTVQVPCLDATTVQTAGDSAFLGGLVARWTEEASALNETEPTFRQVELVAHELSGYAKVSTTLMQDSAAGLEALLLTLFGRAVGWHEDYAFLRGNGAGKPLGILNAGALISVTRSGASAFALADAATMLARLLPGWSRANTVWAMHPTVLAKLFVMSESGTGSDLMIVDRGTDLPTMSLLGIPVVVTEKLPALNTAGDVLLLDLKHYLIGDRQQVEVAYSEHVAFTTNQAAWRFVARVDGQPWLRDKVTLTDASSTLSPFVAVAAG